MQLLFQSETDQFPRKSILESIYKFTRKEHCNMLFDERTVERENCILQVVCRSARDTFSKRCAICDIVCYSNICHSNIRSTAYAHNHGAVVAVCAYRCGLSASSSRRMSDILVHHVWIASSWCTTSYNCTQQTCQKYDFIWSHVCAKWATLYNMFGSVYFPPKSIIVLFSSASCISFASAESVWQCVYTKETHNQRR